MAARFCPVLVVLVPLALLGFVAGAAEADVSSWGCQIPALAAEVAASCAAGEATPRCCAPVLASIELGGGACLCSLASETPVRHAGLNGFTLAALYASCDGAAASPGAQASGSLDPAVRCNATGPDFADLVNDSIVGGAPRVESSSASVLGGLPSPPPVAAFIIVAAVEVFRCI